MNRNVGTKVALFLCLSGVVFLAAQMVMAQADNTTQPAAETTKPASDQASTGGEAKPELPKKEKKRRQKVEKASEKRKHNDTVTHQHAQQQIQNLRSFHGW